MSNKDYNYKSYKAYLQITANMLSQSSSGDVGRINAGLVDELDIVNDLLLTVGGQLTNKQVIAGAIQCYHHRHPNVKLYNGD